MVLPKSLRDKQVQFFKFWANHQLQDGLHYQNELFQRVQTLDRGQRFQIYKFGGDLARQGADILITCHPDGCSLWVNLRGAGQALGLPIELAQPHTPPQSPGQMLNRTLAPEGGPHQVQYEKL
jgi:hypothetical protein